MIENNPYRLVIALMGKGGTNHLHRQEVIDAFRAKNIEVSFLVREDYLQLLTRFSGCRYFTCRFLEPIGVKRFWESFFRYLRSLYPAYDIGMKTRLKIANTDRMKIRQRILANIFSFLARYRFVMALIVRIEKGLYSSDTVQGLNPSSIDQLLLLGIGIAGTELDARLTWWARKNKISVVHLIGNYDGLSSKGYRGVPVKTLLVWGQSMVNDATHLQGISQKAIKMIGAIRYDRIEKKNHPDREAFLRSLKLDPQKKTILFAGSRIEYHYFEFLDVYQQLKMEDDNYQLIVRIYPSKGLLNSVYMAPLIQYASSIPEVFISLGDPHYSSGARDQEVLQIEEDELWLSIKYSDVVVNLFSTLTIEACVFNKPVIQMWYFGGPGKLILRKPIFVPYPDYFHIRKLLSYGGTQTAFSRKELIDLINEAIRDPEKLKRGRRLTVEKECGILDGKASQRLADACLDAYRE